MKNKINWTTSQKVQFWWSWIILLSIVPLIYQWINGVVSYWQIFLCVLPCGFLYFNIKSLKSGKLILAEEPYSNSGLEYHREEKENEAFCCMTFSFPIKTDKKYRNCQILAIVICTMVALFCGMTAISFSALPVVNAKIVDAKYENNVSVSSGGGVSSSELSIYTIEYQFENEVFQIELKDRFSKYTKGSIVCLCVNDEGDFVCWKDNIYAFSFVFRALIVALVFIIIGWILRIPLKYLIVVFLGLIGIGLMALFAASDWARFLLHPVSGMGMIFLLPSLMIIGSLITVKLIYVVRKRKDPNYILE